MATNRRLNLILAIGLALLLPTLGNFAKGVPDINMDFMQKWAISFLFILILWYTFLMIRRWKSKPEERRAMLTRVLALCTAFASLFLLGFETEHTLNVPLLIRVTFLTVIINVVQHTLFTQERLTTLRVEKEQLQSENLKIQLKELRNQMDPHFFFNSLNTLRSMVRQNHENSEPFIIGLSDFYRQTLKNQENTTLPLSEELKVLKSYLFLMKNRNEKALETQVEEIDDRYDAYKIPTLALQSVVENCFKHNIMSSKMPLKITIRTTDDAYVEVLNNLQPKLSPQDTSGLGLNLLKKRYELLRIEKGVIIKAMEHTFSVKLKLIPAP